MKKMAPAIASIGSRRHSHTVCSGQWNGGNADEQRDGKRGGLSKIIDRIQKIDHSDIWVNVKRFFLSESRIFQAIAV